MTSTLVTPLDLSARIAKGEVTVLDVRTPGEYQAASIADSAHLPLDQLPAHSPRIAGRLAQPVALVCGSGQRAQKAADLLARDGARDLLPAEYAYRLTNDALKGLTPGTYRFRATARAPRRARPSVVRSREFAVR